MTSRDLILRRIGAALRAGSDAVPVPASSAIRTRGEADADGRLHRFVAHARAYKVTVERCSLDEVATVVGRLVRDAGCSSLVLPAGVPDAFLPRSVTLVPDDALNVSAIAACEGVLTTCACAIAQTGTVVLDHGPGQGRRLLTLLPDFHLCLVEEAQIVDLVPEAVARLETSLRAGRPLTFVSGPSATSDIELSRVEGVHGPRRLAILCIIGRKDGRVGMPLHQEVDLPDQSHPHRP